MQVHQAHQVFQPVLDKQQAYQEVHQQALQIQRVIRVQRVQQYHIVLQ